MYFQIGYKSIYFKVVIIWIGTINFFNAGKSLALNEYTTHYRQNHPEKKVMLIKELEISQANVKKKYRIDYINNFVVSAKGYIYTIHVGNRFIQMFDSKNGKYKKTIVVKGQGRTLSIATGPDGHVFVADPESGKIWEFDQNLNEINTISLHMRNGPVNFAIDKHSNFFICFPRNEYRIHKYSRDGNFITSFAEPPDIAQFYNTNERNKDRIQERSSGTVSLDDSGYVYYSNRNPCEIQKFTNDGNFLKKIYRHNEFVLPITEYIRLKGGGFRFGQVGGSYSITVSNENGVIINNLLRPIYTDNRDRIQYWDSLLDFYDLEGNWISSIIFEKQMLDSVNEDENGFIYLLDRTTRKPKIIKYSIKYKD